MPTHPVTVTEARPAVNLGVHSEVGRLRKVLVCLPGLAHRRLTPTNSDELLFDDVMWVENAQRDHLDFVNKLRTRGVEVVELHALLAETIEVPGARAWLLDRKIIAVLFADEAADRVIVAGMPKLRAAMHLDTVFTFADRDAVALEPGVLFTYDRNIQTITCCARPASRSSRSWAPSSGAGGTAVTA